MLPESEIVIRLLLSAFIGAFIGWERERIHRPAGLRTHMLVAIGSTLITLVSIDAVPGDDYTRLAAGIVTGIGFLGAGTIFKFQDHVVGLTTAASIWAIAGIGIAIGTGYYLAAIVTSLIIYFTLKINIIEKGKKNKGFKIISIRS